MAKQPSPTRAAKRAAAPTKTVKADLTKPAQFDIEAFVAGAVVPNDTCRVTNNPAIVQRLAELENESIGIRQAVAMADQAAEAGNDSIKRRLASKPDHEVRLRAIEDEVAELLADETVEWIEVTFRAIDPFEKSFINTQNPKNEVHQAILYFAASGTVRKAGDGDDAWKPMGADSWKALVDVIGVRQFEELDRVCASVCFGDTVGPDFWRRFSPSHNTTTS